MLHELSPRERRSGMSDEITGKTVRFASDPANPPRLTADERQRLDSMSDEEIDLGEIPPQAGKPGWRPGLYGPGVSEMRRAALREGLLLLDQDVVNPVSYTHLRAH